MKSYKLMRVISVSIFIASLTLSGCASNSLCHAAYDVTEGAVNNYDSRQERESRDPFTVSDGKFKDEDLVTGVLFAGLSGISRLFSSDSEQECP